MKISATWRLLIMVAGTLLAVAAGLGTAAPASAAHIDARGSSLSLTVSSNGSYTVRGSGYSARTVHVWVVNISTDRAVNERPLKPNNGSFSFSGSGLGCDASYKAVSFSKQDGWDESKSVHRKC
jgi:hypothetical protein